MKTSNRHPTHHVQKVFGDRLKVEEKLQILGALMSTCEQKTDLLISSSIPDLSDKPRTEGPYHCGTCDKSYNVLWQYYGHLKKHEGSVKCSSPQCPTQICVFQSLSHLRRHRKWKGLGSEVQNGKYCDDGCSHSWVKSKCQFNVHADHTQLICQLCDKKFHRKSDLRSHIATHLSLRLSVCEVCGRSFSHISNLIRHSYLHSGVKPYPCKICGQRFTQLTSLNQHNISHHSDDLIPCPALPEECDKMFRTPIIAKQHAYRMHPDVPLPWDCKIMENKKRQRSHYCRVCGETFISAKYLKVHNLQLHKSSSDITEKGVDGSFTLNSTFKDRLLKIDSGSLVVGKEKCIIPKTGFAVNGSENREDENDTKEHKISSKEPSARSDCGLKDVSRTTASEGTVIHNPLVSCRVENMINETTVEGITSDHQPKLKKSYANREMDTHFKVNWTLKRFEDNFTFPSVLENTDRVFEDNSVSSDFSSENNVVVGASIYDNHENNPNNLRSELGGSQLKQSDGSLVGVLEHFNSEKNGSAMAYDVNMGICPDSPNGTGSLSNEHDYDNDKDLRDEFAHEKCLENYQNGEPLITSFGDSYSALLKEIGIGEEDAKDDIEISDIPTNQDNGEPLSSFWENYAALFKEVVMAEENPCADQKTMFPTTQEQYNHQVLSEHNPNHRTSNMQDTTQEISDKIIAHSSEEICQPEDIVIYVPQENCAPAKILVKPSRATIESYENSEHSNVAKEKISIALISKNSQRTNKNKILHSKSRGEMLDDFNPRILVFCSGDKNSSLNEKSTNHHPTNNSESMAAQKNDTEKQREVKTNKSLPLPATILTKVCRSQPRRTKRDCPECGKTFLKGANLNQHLGLHFPNMKLYECFMCKMTFSWKSSLNKHMNTHTNILKPFLCDICGKQYKSFNQVQQHKKRDHQSLRPNICGVCNKSFFRKYDLLIHQRIHTNQKPYMCEICGKIFNHISHVKRHEKVHSKDKDVTSLPMTFSPDMVQLQ